MSRWWSSFRVRLIVASLAWTTGLLYVAHLASVLVLFGADGWSRFSPRIAPTVLVALALMILGAWIARRALQTFSELRHRLIDVHEGRHRIVIGSYLREVQPVVIALNRLLEHQDRRVREALTKAGDLAHGLKTPLAVLRHEADRAAAEGHHELATTVGEQVERMHRYIEYHLAHARAAASGATPGAHCAVAAAAEGIVRTLRQLHAQRGLSIVADVPAHHVVRSQREDLDEMLGNLLDNACKWARARVTVASVAGDGHVEITVDDDGPGIPTEMSNAVLQRGVRADEAAPGSGFGLAITRELAGLYHGGLSLERSSFGGLRARLRLPQPSSEHSVSVQVH